MTSRSHHDEIRRHLGDESRSDSARSRTSMDTESVPRMSELDSSHPRSALDIIDDLNVADVGLLDRILDCNPIDGPDSDSTHKYSLQLEESRDEGGTSSRSGNNSGSGANGPNRTRRGSGGASSSSGRKQRSGELERNPFDELLDALLASNSAVNIFPSNESGPNANSTGGGGGGGSSSSSSSSSSGSLGENSDSNSSSTGSGGPIGSVLGRVSTLAAGKKEAAASNDEDVVDEDLVEAMRGSGELEDDELKNRKRIPGLPFPPFMEKNIQPILSAIAEQLDSLERLPSIQRTLLLQEHTPQDLLDFDSSTVHDGDTMSDSSRGVSIACSGDTDIDAYIRRRLATKGTGNTHQLSSSTLDSEEDPLDLLGMLKSTPEGGGALTPVMPKRSPIVATNQRSFPILLDDDDDDDVDLLVKNWKQQNSSTASAPVNYSAVNGNRVLATPTRSDDNMLDELDRLLESGATRKSNGFEVSRTPSHDHIALPRPQQATNREMRMMKQRQKIDRQREIALTNQIHRIISEMRQLSGVVSLSVRSMQTGLDDFYDTCRANMEELNLSVAQIRHNDRVKRCCSQVDRIRTMKTTLLQEQRRTKMIATWFEQHGVAAAGNEEGVGSPRASASSPSSPSSFPCPPLTSSVMKRTPSNSAIGSSPVSNPSEQAVGADVDVMADLQCACFTSAALRTNYELAMETLRQRFTLQRIAFLFNSNRTAVDAWVTKTHDRLLLSLIEAVERLLDEAYKEKQKLLHVCVIMTTEDL